jgi:Glycosyltransferase family 87
MFSFLCNLQILWGKRSYIFKGYFDFVIYYTGAEIANAGKASELYDLDVQRRYQEKFKHANQPWSVLPFNHAPYELLLFLPLAHLSFQTAHIIWTSATILLLILAWQVLVPFLDRKNKFLYLAVLLAFYPTMTTIKMGQDSVVSLLILAGVFAGLKHQRELLAGSILALGLYKPHLVIPLAGILTISEYRRAMLGFVGTGLLLFGVSLAMVGWHGLIGLASIVAGMDRPTSIVYPESMANLRGLSFLLLTLVKANWLTNVLTAILSAFVYGCCLWLWKSKMTENRSLLDLRYALAVVTTVLVSFHLYAHDAIILVIPLTILLSYVLQNRAQTRFVHDGSIAVLAVFNLPLLAFFLEIRGGLGWGVLPVIFVFILIASEICSLMACSVHRSAPELVTIETNGR